MRLRLTRDIYVPGPDKDGLGRLEAALDAVVVAAPARDQVKAALRDGTLPKGDVLSRLDDAVNLGVIRADQARLIEAGETIRKDFIQVDVFDPETYMTLR